MMKQRQTDVLKFSCPQCGASVTLPGYADLVTCYSCGSTLERARARANGVALVTEAVAPEGQTLYSVRCSQCAGPLEVREGRRILVCDHCGVRVAVKQHGGFSRWYFPPRVDQPGAIRAGAVWLGKHPGVANKARAARFTEAQMVYMPVWEHKALVAGWEFGYKLRTQYELAGDEDNARLDLRLAREGVEEPYLQERRFYQAATNLDELGVRRPRMTGRELLVPLLAEEIDKSAIVLEAEGTAAEVAARAQKAMLQPVSGATSPDSHMFAMRERTSLLYYPLWLLHYECGSRFYRIVVNGRDGTVNSARAPAGGGGRVARLAIVAGVLTASIAFLLWVAVSWEAMREVAIVAAVIVSAIAVFSVWRFRVQGEVEYHEPFSS